MTELIKKLFVKDYENTESPAVRARYGAVAGAVGIVTNLLLAAAKMTIGFFFGAISVVADGINNLTDSLSSIITLVGFRMSAAQADEDHPYGHARFEYLSGLAVAALVIVIGAELGKSAIEKIIAPVPVEISWAMALVLAVSALVKLWMCHFNRQLSQCIDSSALAATAVDSRNDAVSTLAVLAAALIERYASWRVDGVMGLAVAAFILYSGWNLAKDTIGPLLGEAASPQLQKLILTVFAQQPKVLGYHDLM
ncbi:MAG: cation transporter, partial [Clostridia bacterium]|nr:cation transporter [Clostridia bacterium]